MKQTFERVAEIIVKSSDVQRDSIQPDSHLVEDLGLDSVDMFDVVFAIEQEFDVDLPVEEWGEESGSEDALQIADLVMKNFCARIDALMAEKGQA